MKTLKEMYVTEAAPITFDELPPDKIDDATKILKIFGVEPMKTLMDVFDGLAGYIITFKPKIGGDNGRKFYIKELRDIMKIKSVRWISSSDKYISVGF